MKYNKNEMESKTTNYKYFFVLFLVSVLLLSSASAALQTLGTFKQGETVRVKQICSDATYITISSIDYPGGVVAVSDVNMTYFGNAEWHYNFTNTTLLGDYKIAQVSDGCEGTATYIFDVTLSGVKPSMTLIIADIFLVILIALLIFVLHSNYRKVSYSDSDKNLAEAHSGNWGGTFIKTLGNGLMRNSFLWYYSLGWLLLIVLKDLVHNFNGVEVYQFFVFFLDIYSFGFFLVIIVWIGILIKHFTIITDMINDMNLGVDR